MGWGVGAIVAKRRRRRGGRQQPRWQRSARARERESLAHRGHVIDLPVDRDKERLAAVLPRVLLELLFGQVSVMGRLGLWLGLLVLLLPLTFFVPPHGEPRQHDGDRRDRQHRGRHHNDRVGPTDHQLLPRLPHLPGLVHAPPALCSPCSRGPEILKKNFPEMLLVFRKTSSQFLNERGTAPVSPGCTTRRAPRGAPQRLARAGGKVQKQDAGHRADLVRRGELFFFLAPTPPKAGPFDPLPVRDSQSGLVPRLHHDYPPRLDFPDRLF